MSSRRTGLWKSLTLIEVATLQRGFDLPVQDRVSGSIPIFAANGKVGTHHIAKVSGPGVVTGRSGSIGKVHYVEGDFWPLNTALFVKDFHGHHSRFVYYLLQQMRLEQYHEGTGVPTLNRNNVHGIEVSVPPLEEQRRIAGALDRAEALRAKRRAALAQLDSLTQAIFFEMFGDPATNPKGWPIRILSQVCNEINDCPHSTPVWTGAGVICLRTSNLTSGDWDWSETRYVSNTTYIERAKRGNLEPGDIVLSREGTVGIAAIVTRGMKACLGQRLVQVRPAREILVSEFLLRELLYYLAPARIERVMVGSTSRHLNVKELRALRVPLPPVILQREFARRIAAVEKLKTAHRTSLAELDALFASLQHRAFRGEL